MANVRWLKSIPNATLLPMTFPTRDTIRAFWPIAAVIIPVGVGAAITWAKDLNAAARRARALDECTKRLQFWDSWLKTIGTLNTAKEGDFSRATTEIRDAGMQVESLYPRIEFPETLTMSAYASYRRKHSILKQALLMYRQPDSRTTMFRAMFWFNIVYFPLTSGFFLYRADTGHLHHIAADKVPELKILIIVLGILSCLGYWGIARYAQNMYFRRSRRRKRVRYEL